MGVFFSSHLFAQSFYVVNPVGVISRLTLKNSTYTQQIITNPCLSEFRTVYSIAIYKNYFYYFDFNGLIRATIVGNELTNCENLGKGYVGGEALTVDQNGILYVANGYNLYKIDLAAKSQIKIGTMPYSGGDLLFYKDELYMASYGGIVKVNLADPSQSRIVIPEARNASGLVSAAYSGSKNKVYALVGVTAVEIDLDNYKVVSQPIEIDVDVVDGASAVEDGEFLKIQIDSIRQYPDCPYTGKGTIEVICENKLPDYTFELNGVTNNTGIFTGLSPGTFQIKVRSSAEEKDTVITVPRFMRLKPPINITTSDDLCVAPGQITLTTDAANDTSYSIKYNNAIYSVNHSYTNLKAGNHQFIVLNKAGCEIDTINVLLHKCAIQLDGADVQQECNLIFKGSVQIKTKATAVYTYKLGDTTNQTGIFNGLDKGNYKVTITSADDTTQMDVIIPDYAALSPVISYNATKANCETTGSVKFNLTGDATGYTIKLDGQVYPFLHEFKLYGGTYSFTVIKPDGCLLNLYTVTITSEACDDLFLPNTFTPNGDGINDIFKLEAGDTPDNFKFRIYNRYGVLVFSSVNSHVGWDGKSKGKPVPVGVYYWTATYVDNGRRSLEKSGYVTLIR
ncbi:gliding motility-associated C-terminal domain-containing protein [Mucilaginibacter panaciglaebae]|uniref:Gliding motility-associated-like protein n=1 Tax=Mucilaginibacter panaciglaebae TaxID=502331 RepID=A0ABP7WIQ7_9SPHI